VTQDTGAKIFESKLHLQDPIYQDDSDNTYKEEKKKKLGTVSESDRDRSQHLNPILVPRVCGKITPKTHTETPTL
jgi:hypothetical protein